MWDPTLCCRSALLLVFAYFLFILLSSVLNVVAVEIFWGPISRRRHPNLVWSETFVVIARGRRRRQVREEQCMNRDRRDTRL